MTRPRDLCACSHARGDHEHYRPGSDCSRCPCSRFHRPGGAFRRVLARLRNFPAGRHSTGWAVPATSSVDAPTAGLRTLLQPPPPETRSIDAVADGAGCGCMACQIEWPTDEHDADDQQTTHYRSASYVGRHRIETAPTGLMPAVRPSTPRGSARLN